MPLIVFVNLKFTFFLSIKLYVQLIESFLTNLNLIINQKNIFSTLKINNLI